MTPLRSVITYVPYMPGAISRRISTKTPLILMMAMSFSYSMQVCMKSFGVSKVATSWCSYVYMMHVGRTDLVANFGYLASSLDIKSICLFPSAAVLPLRVPSLFSFSKMWYSRIVFLYYPVKYFLCRGITVSLIWNFFIS